MPCTRPWKKDVLRGVRLMGRAPHGGTDGQFMQPAISIVVHSYNQPPEFVSECLASIFAQKGASYEVIFVDGQSSPETLAAVEPFRSRCAHFISDPDEGQADALNKALRFARRGPVQWLNTHDFYEPRAFHETEYACNTYPAAPFH